MKPNRTFETRLSIQAPREAVWRALTEAREIARWFAPTVEAEPRVGGRLVWQWGQQHVWPQTIEVFEPGQHLRTRYDSGVAGADGKKRPLFVDFHLEGHGGVTALRLVHSGFGPEASFDEEFDGISGGWSVELRSLRLYLEQHRGRDRMLAWSTRSSTLSAGEAWQRLTGVSGLAVGALPSLSEGERFGLEVPGAGVIQGRALASPSQREFSGVVDNLDRGWFRVHCEHWGGATHAWLWLAIYEGPKDRVARFQGAFDAVLDRVFASAGAQHS